MTQNYRIERITSGTFERAPLVNALSDILQDCVEGGASVSFMNPLSRQKASRFWEQAIDGALDGERILLVARDIATGRVDGTVSVGLAMPENQPHRGDLSKMLVHRRARRQGLGAALMKAAEEAAIAAGRDVLVLDTATGDAERLYERMGWTRCGQVPEFALWPDGGRCATTFFYRLLRR